MAATLKLIAGPQSEPVSVAELKIHAIIYTTDEDDYLADLIAAAREQLEGQTRRALMTQTWEMRLDAWPASGVVLVPRPPLRAWDEELDFIKYIDTTGTEQTLDAGDYRVDSSSQVQPGRITPAYGCTWPSVRSITGAITVRFRGGYGDAASAVPARLRRALMVLAGTYYENREDTSPGVPIHAIPGPTSYTRAIGPFKVPWFEGLGV